jgi:7-cyano-7-deazaguanine synthase
MATRAFVLLSGGLDSTTCLFKAVLAHCPEGALHALHTLAINQDRDLATAGEDDRRPIDWVEAISFNYGQRHAKEIACARHLCNHLGIKHTTRYLGDLITDENTMLANPDIEVPNISYADIEGVSPTYVPFRNGTMLSVMAAQAQKWVNRKDNSPMEDEAFIYFGAHAEDAANWAYPDCTPEFIGAMANAIYIGTYHKVRLLTPLQWLIKSEIVELGRSLDVPFELTWSCYKGEELHCGVCPTCRSRKQAFIDASIPDPTEYADDDDTSVDDDEF